MSDLEMIKKTVWVRTDDVLGLLVFTGEVVLEDALGSGSVASLRIEGRPGVMRDHTVTTTEGVLHGTPDVVLRGRLDVPDIAGVTRKVTAGQSTGNSILVTDGTTSGVDEPSALLEVLQEFVVDETAGTFVQRAVDGHDITLGYQVLIPISDKKDQIKERYTLSDLRHERH